MKGQCHQWRPLARLEAAVVGVAAEEHHSMAWAVAVVAVAVVRAKNAWTLVMGRKTEEFVEGVELHDMGDVRRAVEVVGRSAEAAVGVVRARARASEWEREQDGLD